MASTSGMASDGLWGIYTRYWIDYLDRDSEDSRCIEHFMGSTDIERPEFVTAKSIPYPHSLK